MYLLIEAYLFTSYCLFPRTFPGLKSGESGNFAYVDLIRQYFPDLTKEQDEQFAKLQELYEYWNERINLISRKDIDKLEERHILHSLAIAQVIQFKPGTKILDVGTGGGFPGIPLAIMFPKARFTLVDSTGKKIMVVNEIASALKLKNVKGLHQRAEEVDGHFDFIISRAVTRLPVFVKWVKSKVIKKSKNTLQNGILYLKGGDLEEELSDVRWDYALYDLDAVFSEEFFQSKKVVYIPLAK